ncbi:MAG: PAS domain-containing protein [Thermoplasmatota archaeon]
MIFVESYQRELAHIRNILKQNPKGMTVTDIAREIHINRNSVAKYLDILLISGHAEMITFGPAKVFFPCRRIPLSAILNLTMDYILLLDKDLKCIQMNDNLLKIADLEKKNIIGQNIHSISKPILQMPELHHNAKKALNGEESFIEKNLVIHKKTVYLSIKHIPTTFDDGEPGVTIIIEDITKRKESEEKMKQAVKEWDVTFNCVSDMISILDKNFTIIRANKSFSDLFHSTPKQCIGKKCFNLIHGLKKNAPLCPCKKIVDTKKPEKIEFFEPHLRKSLSILISPIMNDDNEVSGFVHIMKKTADEQ